MWEKLAHNSPLSKYHQLKVNRHDFWPEIWLLRDRVMYTQQPHRELRGKPRGPGAALEKLPKGPRVSQLFITSRFLARLRRLILASQPCQSCLTFPKPAWEGSPFFSQRCKKKRHLEKKKKLSRPCFFSSFPSSPLLPLCCKWGWCWGWAVLTKSRRPLSPTCCFSDTSGRARAQWSGAYFWLTAFTAHQSTTQTGGSRGLHPLKASLPCTPSMHHQLPIMTKNIHIWLHLRETHQRTSMNSQIDRLR